tara:strand:+ start:700 stop:879 length:180 start_codon:yes stop_codon:yes gene_type:complete
MPQLGNNEIDPLKTPLDRAEKLWNDQLKEAIEIIIPKQTRSNPVADAMRLVGIRKRDIR